MKMYLDNSKVCEISTGCLVIAVVEDGPLGPSAAAVNEASGGMIEAMVESGDIQAKTGKTTLLHRPPGIAAERLLVVGMGKADKLSLARFHRACYAAGKVLRDHPVRQCHVCLQEVDVEGADSLSLLRQAALAVHRGNYLYTVTKQRKDDAPAPLESASFQAAPDMQAAYRTG